MVAGQRDSDPGAVIARLIVGRVASVPISLLLVVLFRRRRR